MVFTADSLDKVYELEAGGNSWTELPAMLTARRDHACLFIQLETSAGILVTGGLGKEDEVQLQNFILRALGQIMLYVDGMQGVMQHIQARASILSLHNSYIILYKLEYKRDQLSMYMVSVIYDRDLTPWCRP